MKTILFYLNSWSLTSSQLLLALIGMTLVGYLIILFLRSKQQKKIEQLSLNENLKGYQNGNALRSKRAFRMLGSAVTAIVAVVLCSSWIYSDDSNIIERGCQAGSFGDSEEHGITMIGAVELIENNAGGIGTWHAQPSTSIGDAGYGEDEQFDRIKSHIRNRRLPVPPPPPEPICNLVIEPVQPDDEEVTNCYPGIGVDDELILEDYVLEDHDMADTPLPPEVFSIVEQMPRFPGCEDIDGDNASKKQCADQKMLQFIYKNIKYPPMGRDHQIEGLVVVSFVVGRDGYIKDTKVLRDPGSGWGKEGLRIIKLMNNLPERWTPGMQRGQAVEVRYNVPIRIKLH
ncbi:MAG: energy transducer TonB [Aureispira sp.]|nr:energy transducer TonB [Aureispira sp.]